MPKHRGAPCCIIGLPYVKTYMADNRSKVEKLSDSLYSRTRYKNPLDKRSAVHEVESPAVEEKWQGPSLDEMLSHERTDTEITPIMKKIFVFALLFFIAAIGVAGFVFFGGSNFISSSNVDMKVVGPTTISAGEPLDLGVTISNRNNTDLELAAFSVQYPDGSRDPSDSGKPLTYTREELNVIKAGGEAVRDLKLTLLGSTGEVKEFKLSLDYKVKGSSATFHKDKVYDVTIGQAPLTLNVDSPATVTSGEDFTTNLTVTLNSTDVLKNVMLRAEYPYGFTADGADPAPVSENNVWALGDLAPGSVKKIALKGNIVGENNDERTMRFYVGVGDGASLSSNFKTVIASTQNTLAINRPSVGLTINFNGENSSTYVAPAGQNINTSIRFENNMPDKLLAPHLEVRMAGSALNRASISPQNSGIFDPSNTSINWDLTNSQGETALSPGDNGAVSFSFASNPDSLASGSQDILVRFVLSGKSASGLEPISVTETRTIHLASKVTLSAKSLYSTGPYANKGPMPPQAGQETTYSIILSLINTQGDVGNAKVSMKLGSNVKWVGASGSSDGVSYDDKANIVTWKVGTLSSGTGFSSDGKQASFQVSLTPSNSQIGGVPVLVSGITFSGQDSSSGNNVNVTVPALTTRLDSDPAFIQGDDIVVK